VDKTKKEFMSIKYIGKVTPQFKNRDIVKQIINIIETNSYEDDIITELLLLGFKKLGQRGDVYRSVKHGLIVKWPNLLHNISPKIKPYAIPTIAVSTPDDDVWYIQPIANRSNPKEAHDQLLKIFGPEYYKFVDLNIGNVGHYEGKPVLFDW
jgi:hypothetical protein